jgi:predicted DsbA family dithiol-disulfide isomerase
MRFAITFDYLCPFAAIANETVVAALEDPDGAGHEVEFKAFSLSQVHLQEGDTPVWEAETPPSGVPALLWGLAVRDKYPESFNAVHCAIFQARHLRAADINDEAVLREIVAGAGLDPEDIARVVATGEPARALAADHTWGVETHRVFGVPTWIAGDRAVFTRIMQRAADKATATHTVERVLDLITGWPELNELKQTRIPR